MREKTWEVHYVSDESYPYGYRLMGIYKTRESAEKAATRAVENIAYGELYIYNTKTKENYECWPIYNKKRMRA